MLDARSRRRSVSVFAMLRTSRAPRQVISRERRGEEPGTKGSSDETGTTLTLGKVIVDYVLTG